MRVRFSKRPVLTKSCRSRHAFMILQGLVIFLRLLARKALEGVAKELRKELRKSCERVVNKLE